MYKRLIGYDLIAYKILTINSHATGEGANRYLDPRGNLSD